MILSDALVEEIFQTLIRLPFGTVEQLVSKLRGEVAVAKMVPPVTVPFDPLAAARNFPDTIGHGPTIDHEG